MIPQIDPEFEALTEYRRCELVIDADKRQKINSRVGAQKLRPMLLETTGGLCECCDIDCGPIAEVHHLVPIKQGGGPDAENLVVLCPNCHATVGKLLARGNNREKQRCLEEWIGCAFDAHAMRKLALLANGERPNE